MSNFILRYSQSESAKTQPRVDNKSVNTVNLLSALQRFILKTFGLQLNNKKHLSLLFLLKSS